MSKCSLDTKYIYTITGKKKSGSVYVPSVAHTVLISQTGLKN